MRRLLSFSLAAMLAVPSLAQVRPERLPQLMDRLERSQKQVQSKQEMLLSYQRTTGGSERTRLFVEERLRDLVRSEAENAQAYGEFKRTLAAAGAPADREKVEALEAAQRAVELTHGQLATAFGAFYQRLTPATLPVPPPPPDPPARADLFAFGAAPPTGYPAPATLPAGPSGARTPAITPTNQMQAMPMAPDDSEAAYKKAVTQIQSVLASDTATSEQKAAAYRRFLELSAARRARKQ